MLDFFYFRNGWHKPSRRHLVTALKELLLESLVGILFLFPRIHFRLHRTSDTNDDAVEELLESIKNKINEACETFYGTNFDPRLISERGCAKLRALRVYVPYISRAVRVPVSHVLCTPSASVPHIFYFSCFFLHWFCTLRLVPCTLTDNS